MLKRLKKNYYLLVSTFLILYFFFNLLSGQRGLISNFEKKQILKNLQNEEFLMTNQIKDLRRSKEDLNKMRESLTGDKSVKIVMRDLTEPLQKKDSSARLKNLNNNQKR